MTNQEAARILSYLIDRCHSEAEEIAVKKATKVLQEREERSKGCEVCNTNPKAVWYRFKNRNVLCSFCPVCGRRLKGAQDENS